ncbi:hypothetical protein EA71_02254 [Enterococcus durans]|uniref:Uncharacterized protein n=1 Tax=Enterococcus durans TaxID=53345 RepID=A0A367CFV3_9ENTE|nr:hypothetical protein EA71_02254 [Enterococcus durans]
MLRVTRHAYLLAKALLQAKRKFFTTFSFMFKDISWSVDKSKKYFSLISSYFSELNTSVPASTKNLETFEN